MGWGGDRVGWGGDRVGWGGDRVGWGGDSPDRAVQHHTHWYIKHSPVVVRFNSRVG